MNINTKWLMAALADWTILAAAMFLGCKFPLMIPLAILVIGNRQHALGILGHDGSHQSVCRKHRGLNDLLTNVFAFIPLGICMREYRNFHWDHHRHTNNDRDPEVLLKHTMPNPITGPVTVGKVVRHGVMDLLGFGIPHEIRFMYYIRPRTFRDAVPMACLIAATIAAIYVGLYLVPVLWFASTATSFWFFFRLRVWTEHVGLGEGETLRFTPTRAERWLFLPHNTWLHFEHHQHPSVSFDNLPKLRTEIFPSLRQVITG